MNQVTVRVKQFNSNNNQWELKVKSVGVWRDCCLHYQENDDIYMVLQPKDHELVINRRSEAEIMLLLIPDQITSMRVSVEEGIIEIPVTTTLYHYTGNRIEASYYLNYDDTQVMHFIWEMEDEI